MLFWSFFCAGKSQQWIYMYEYRKKTNYYFSRKWRDHSTRSFWAFVEPYLTCFSAWLISLDCISLLFYCTNHTLCISLYRGDLSNTGRRKLFFLSRKKNYLKYYTSNKYDVSYIYLHTYIYIYIYIYMSRIILS